jgi:ZIP family zinc transporter
MLDLTTILLIAWLAGLASFAGGVIALVEGSAESETKRRIVHAVMAFGGGGILYLIFQDITPEAKMKRHWAPILGAVLGFAVGMMGKKLIG